MQALKKEVHSKPLRAAAYIYVPNFCHCDTWLTDTATKLLLQIPEMNIVAKGQQVGGTMMMISNAIQGDVIKPVILAAKVV
eukprot:scaffold10297_cov16-Tisochrysis_lutea.AAC.1